MKLLRCTLSPLSALFLLAALLLFSNCALKKKYNPKFTFNPQQIPTAPDYSKPGFWAALPLRNDMADQTPNASIKNMQATAAVDVFYLHPTMLLQSHKHGNVWNGDLSDAKLNKKVDEVAILYQATAFNGAGKIYAPRYRQAHYWSFLTKDKASADQALNLAYSDVVTAFRYYLQHDNNGRPFIIVGHSQGARHAARLIKEELENKPQMGQLVAAYIVGWPVSSSTFKQIKPCATPDATGCFCAWRTYEHDFGLKNASQDSIVVTNPISWQTNDGKLVSKSLQKGAVLKKFHKIYPSICDAQTYRGVLLCTKPKFPGSFLLRSKNYHAGDINLYYLDVRENAILRAKMFTLD